MMYEKTPFLPHPYGQLVAEGAIVPSVTEERYARSAAYVAGREDIDISRLVYDSDGLAVTGLELLPKTDRPLPLVIYNRGGNREFGKLAAGTIGRFLLPIVERMPCAILASNYRGNDGGEGKEEFGGADVADILHLLDHGKRQPWWDGNVFMLGWSRGGMMTYLALKAGAKVNAAAVGAGEADLWAGARERPEMEENVFAELIPGWPASREQGFEERSALRWIDRLDAPLLILHGDADWRVDVSHGRRMAEGLRKLGKPHRYVEYAGDDHGLSQNHAQVIDEITQWFQRHAHPDA